MHLYNYTDKMRRTTIFNSHIFYCPSDIDMNGSSIMQKNILMPSTQALTCQILYGLYYK